MDERPLLLDDNTIAKLRTTLEPVRERYGFKYTMERWAELVLDDFLHPANTDRAVEPIENMAELVAQILDAPREAVDLTEDEPAPRRGRPRADLERYAALLLAVIFHEYTRTKPTRVTRWECLNHIIIFDERHLRCVLSAYFQYHHQSRTHLSLNKDCPEPRPIQPPSAGTVIAFTQVGGLHHRYERRAA